jgi:adenosyl cobinamide kinase/adenosyl cobinamide phosphate guanylyltransferase
MGRVLFHTGPVRSGKSSAATTLAEAWGPNVVYAASYRPDPGDAEMADRLRRHREERPPWRTLEAVEDVAASLAALDPAPDGVVLDCLTLWMTDRMDLSDEEIFGLWKAQLTAFRAFPWPIVIVGNEVGWAPVPGEPLLRRFRDLAGTLGQITAAEADEVRLYVAGLPVVLKG